MSGPWPPARLGGGGLAAIAARREQVRRLVEQGMSIRRIAEQLGVSKPTVVHDCQVLREQQA